MTLTKSTPENDVTEIDLVQMAKALWYKLWFLIISSVVCAALFLTYTVFLVTPLYQSSVVFYVNNSNISLGSASLSISSSDITAAKSLVDTYIVILKTPETMEEIKNTSGVPYSPEQLANMVTASAMNSTEIFKITVTGASPEEILKIAKTIGTVLPNRIANIVEGSDVRIVNNAELTESRISPSYSKNTAIGFILGLLISGAIVVIKELLNNTVRSEDILTSRYTIPVLTVVPDMNQKKSGYKYQYYKSTGKGSNT